MIFCCIVLLVELWQQVVHSAAYSFCCRISPRKSLVLHTLGLAQQAHSVSLKLSSAWAGAPRLPGFHTCVGGGGSKQEPGWYKEHGGILLSQRFCAFPLLTYASDYACPCSKAELGVHLIGRSDNCDCILLVVSMHLLVPFSPSLDWSWLSWTSATSRHHESHLAWSNADISTHLQASSTS